MTGSELKALRLRLGYSISEMAAALAVSPSTVCRWQSGDSKISRRTATAVLTLRPKKS